MSPVFDPSIFKFPLEREKKTMSEENQNENQGATRLTDDQLTPEQKAKIEAAKAVEQEKEAKEAKPAINYSDDMKAYLAAVEEANQILAGRNISDLPLNDPYWEARNKASILAAKNRPGV